MKPTSFATVLVIAGACLAISRDAHAQSFDTIVWTPLSRSALVITDATGPVPNELDVVGDALSPAVFVGSDATHLYMRIRVNDKPTNPDGTFKSSLWGCVIETDAVLTTYEFLTILDGQDSVQWRFNQTESIGPNVPTEPAEILVGTAARTTHARTVDTMSATPFSGTADWFVDMAMPWAIIRAGGSGTPKLAAGAPMRFVCGTSALTFDISNDQATTAASGALDASWSDAYVCASTGCVLDTGPITPPMDAGVDAARPPTDAGPVVVDASVPVDAGITPLASDDGAVAGTGLICAATQSPRSSNDSRGEIWIIVASVFVITVKLRRTSGR